MWYNSDRARYVHKSLAPASSMYFAHGIRGLAMVMMWRRLVACINAPNGTSFLRHAAMGGFGRACICQHYECVIAFTDKFHDICHSRAKEVILHILSLRANGGAGCSRHMDPDENTRNCRSYRSARSASIIRCAATTHALARARLSEFFEQIITSTF
jgi:hypothetical protein